MIRLSLITYQITCLCISSQIKISHKIKTVFQLFKIRMESDEEIVIEEIEIGERLVSESDENGLYCSFLQIYIHHEVIIINIYNHRIY